MNKPIFLSVYKYFRFINNKVTIKTNNLSNMKINNKQ